MARERRGIFGRAREFVRNVGRILRAEPTREETPRRPRVPFPEPPPREAPQEPEFRPASAPVYDPDTNKWAGISAADWRTMQRLMDSQIREGANYNDALTEYTWASEEARRNLKPSDRQRIYIDAYPPDQRYSYIIDVLESGLLTPEEMLRHLRVSESLARQYANGDKRAARARWESRDPELPAELFFYHWSF